jgi:hypothetical protein
MEGTSSLKGTNSTATEISQVTLVSSLQYPLKVHIYNVTAYRNAVTSQVIDTIRSYELNFHPVPQGVTVTGERYTLEFTVCYGSPSDVFAASSGFVNLNTSRFKEERTVVTSRCPSTPAQAVTVSSF